LQSNVPRWLPKLRQDVVSPPARCAHRHRPRDIATALPAVPGHQGTAVTLSGLPFSAAGGQVAALAHLWRLLRYQLLSDDQARVQMVAGSPPR
jgi:hypothetical protein